MDVQIPHSNAMAPAELLMLLSCCAADGRQCPAGPVSQQQHALQQGLFHAVILAERFRGILCSYVRLVIDPTTSSKVLKTAGPEMHLNHWGADCKGAVQTKRVLQQFCLRLMMWHLKKTCWSYRVARAIHWSL
jgi:hypothetical protein